MSLSLAPILWSSGIGSDVKKPIATPIVGGSEKIGGKKMKRVAVLFISVLLLLAAAALPTTRAVAQQETVTADNLDQMIANMKTPADHEAIAAYFDQVAADARKKAELHHHSAETYRTMKIAKPVGMANMCDAIAADFDKTATEAERLAKAHREMAKKAGGQTGQ